MASLYAWGANSHGQLALGFESEMCKTPQHVQRMPSADFADNLLSVAGGGGHSLFLDCNGLVHSCGWNNKGQLGIGVANNVSYITTIPATAFNGNSITHIAAGWDCSAAIDRTGRVYMWGSNTYQQHGTAKIEATIVSVPRMIVLPGQEKCVSVRFGLRTTCFLTNSCIYIVGISKAFNSPEMMNNFDLVRANGIDWWKLDRSVVHIGVGQNHFIWCTDDHKSIQAWGDNRFAQGSTVSLCTDRTVATLESGWTHNGLLNDNGEVFLWGRNNYGQIGRDPFSAGSVIGTPAKLNVPSDKVVRLHLGAEHGLCVLMSGKVVTWGWNEHGNCGNDSEENTYTPTVVDLPGKCRLACCGAGFCYAVVE